MLFSNLDDQYIEDKSLTQEQLESLIQFQHDILEATALSNNYVETLNSLCKLSERLLPNSVGSIMLLDKNQGVLNIIAAPSIPPEAIECLNGTKPSPHQGSCANVIYSGEPQFVVNTLFDSRWANLRQFAQDFNIGACWSLPVYGKQNEIIGTFALSSFVNREPKAFEYNLIHIAAYLAGIIIQRQNLDKKLNYLAYHDSLTNLPNRYALMRHLHENITISDANQHKLAVLFLDLDRFKNINDIYGHSLGDQVLCRVAKRLEKLIQEGVFLSRLGGDEFVLVLQKTNLWESVHHFAQLILKQLEKPIQLGDHIFYLMASIGISLFPEHGSDAKTLLSHADAAMYEAKRKGCNQYCFYSAQLTHRALLKFSLEHDLRQAIKRQEFELYYQPKVLAEDTNLLCGAEALIRWQNPQQGLISPAKFIPIAEEIGLIIPIGEWVTMQACQQLKQWQAQGLNCCRLSINLSNRQLNWSSINRLLTIVEEAKINPKLLEFEITESYLMENIDETTPLLNYIHETGINLALDDFGVGYSSLGILKHLPLNTLKIDKSLVSNILNDSSDQAITQAIITLSKALGLKIVAEGIETAKQKDFLLSLQCDELQGYYFSKPLKKSLFEQKYLFNKK